MLNRTGNHKFLDFGGGTGSTYNAACELGLDVYYYDLDEKAKMFVKEIHGLDDTHIIDDVRRSDMRFDYVFSDNVIEHVKDPVQFIADLKGLLAKGGQLIVKTPHDGILISSFSH